jgi:uncharacterized protein
MNNIDLLLKDITKTISRYKKVNKVILYGSRARGDATERSDIDIAIDAPHITDAEWFLIRENLENLNTLLEIDMVEFSKAGEKLQERILKEGKVLYERDKI